ncbi:retropepsin-like aspartic protease [uncultured Bacteroides sp.]|uniref:retropepsin-like aspartic protease n=1 Tax=uncultured Bacteroides sp. TaxID=162156 RepID=UPI00280B7FC8|nr:retropepsin-like aspartic protease [uncultured Bacteroides sp.]
MNLQYCIMCLAIIMLTACIGEKKRPAFYDNGAETEIDSLMHGSEISADYDQMTDAEIVSIPFSERDGVKYVNVSVNGFGFEMIFDTGCSGTLISVAEANYLYQKGYLVQDDIIGVAKSQIADGSIVENMVVNLKEIVLDGKIRCTDVTATVSANNNAPLLLGNEVLNRVAVYSVDNKKKTINFKLK